MIRDRRITFTHHFPMPNSVLIVDDEEGIRLSLAGVLEDEGMVAESVASARSALLSLNAILSVAFCLMCGFQVSTGLKRSSGSSLPIPTRLS